MKSIEIAGNPRTDLGKKYAKNARREGLVPCVIYGGDGNVHFSAHHSAFKNLIYTPDFNLAEIKLGDDSYRCILKDAQFHPVTDEIVHLDFLQLVEGKKLNVEIPVRFQGVAPGTKSGGKLVQKLRKVKVKTLPKDLKEEVFIDVTSMELGQSVKVRDIALGEGMELMTSSGIPVASVEVPRALRSAQAGADATADATADEAVEAAEE